MPMPFEIVESTDEHGFSSGAELRAEQAGAGAKPMLAAGVHGARGSVLGVDRRSRLRGAHDGGQEARSKTGSSPRSSRKSA